MSKYLKHSLAAAAILACASAQAVTTYTFAFDGTKTHFLDAWECPGSICAPDQPMIVGSALKGTFTLTAPDGDGVFDWQALTLTENGFVNLALSFPGEQNLQATVQGGMLESLTGNASPGAPYLWTFSGTTFTYNQPAEHHFGATMGRGELIFAAPVPEPESWALMLAGAGLLGALRLRRREAR